MPNVRPVTIVSVSGDNLEAAAMETALHALDGGFVVAVPTDTGYSLVADVSYTGAADRLFAMKRRSRDFALSMLVSDVEQALSLSVGVPQSAERLMAKFWPGALTIVVPRHPDFVADLGDDEETVGVRCPGHSVARQLCDEFGPLATTSANISGRPTISTAYGVVDEFGEGVAVVLDAGECVSTQATVVDCTGEMPKLLQEGAISWDDICVVIG